MPDDFVTRLRSPSGIGEPMDHMSMAEAADEIERLRANEEKLMLQIERAFEIERERCAKVAEEFPTADTYDLARGRHEIAAAIRGRVGTYVNHIILLRRAK